MKARLRIRHRPRPSETAEFRHEIAIKALRTLSALTVPHIETDVLIAYSDDDKRDTSGANLRPLCKEGVSASAYYGPRFPDISDLAMYDDSLTVVFDPDATDYEHVILQELPNALEQFGAYRANLVINDDLEMQDHERILRMQRETGKDVNGRDGVYRIAPVCFFDEELCQRAFGLTTNRVMERIKTHVESVLTLCDGVLVVATLDLAGRVELERIESILRNALGLES